MDEYKIKIGVDDDYLRSEFKKCGQTLAKDEIIVPVSFKGDIASYRKQIKEMFKGSPEIVDRVTLELDRTVLNEQLKNIEASIGNSKLLKKVHEIKLDVVTGDYKTKIQDIEKSLTSNANGGNAKKVASDMKNLVSYTKAINDYGKGKGSSNYIAKTLIPSLLEAKDISQDIKSIIKDFGVSFNEGNGHLETVKEVNALYDYDALKKYTDQTKVLWDNISALIEDINRLKGINTKDFATDVPHLDEQFVNVGKKAKETTERLESEAKQTANNVKQTVDNTVSDVNESIDKIEKKAKQAVDNTIQSIVKAQLDADELVKKLFDAEVFKTRDGQSVNFKATISQLNTNLIGTLKILDNVGSDLQSIQIMLSSIFNYSGSDNKVGKVFSDLKVGRDTLTSYRKALSNIIELLSKADVKKILTSFDDLQTALAKINNENFGKFEKQIEDVNDSTNKLAGDIKVDFTPLADVFNEITEACKGVNTGLGFLSSALKGLDTSFKELSASIAESMKTAAKEAEKVTDAVDINSTANKKKASATKSKTPSKSTEQLIDEYGYANKNLIDLIKNWQTLEEESSKGAMRLTKYNKALKDVTELQKKSKDLTEAESKAQQQTLKEARENVALQEKKNKSYLETRNVLTQIFKSVVGNNSKLNIDDTIDKITSGTTKLEDIVSVFSNAGIDVYTKKIGETTESSTVNIKALSETVDGFNTSIKMLADTMGNVSSFKLDDTFINNLNQSFEKLDVSLSEIISKLKLISDNINNIGNNGNLKISDEYEKQLNSIKQIQEYRELMAKKNIYKDSDISFGGAGNKYRADLEKQLDAVIDKWSKSSDEAERYYAVQLKIEKDLMNKRIADTVRKTQQSTNTAINVDNIAHPANQMSSEANAANDLLGAITNIIDAVDKKTGAFVHEREVVLPALDQEADALVRLEIILKSIKEVAEQVSSSFGNIKTPQLGIKWASNVKDVFKTDDMHTAITNLKSLAGAINGISVKDDNFLTQLAGISKYETVLANLAKVLNSSENKIKAATGNNNSTITKKVEALDKLKSKISTASSSPWLTDEFKSSEVEPLLDIIKEVQSRADKISIENLRSEFNAVNDMANELLANIKNIDTSSKKDSKNLYDQRMAVAEEINKYQVQNAKNLQITASQRQAYADNEEKIKDLLQQEAYYTAEISKLQVRDTAAEDKYATYVYNSAKALKELEASVANSEETNGLKSVSKELSNLEKQFLKIESNGKLSKLFKADEITPFIARIRQLSDSLSDISHDDAVRQLELIRKEALKLSDPNLLKNKSIVGVDRLHTISTQIDEFVKANSRMSSSLKEQFSQLSATLLKEGSLTEEQVAQIIASYQKLRQEVNNSGQSGVGFLDLFSKKLRSVNAQLLAYYLSWADILRYVRTAVNAVKEIDYALVDLRKTTTMSASDLNQFYYDANDVAKQMGITTAQVVDLASSFSRLGYSSKEAATGMAQLAGEFALISPGMDTEVAQTGLVSIQKAFDVANEDLKREILDNINIIGNNFATSNDEIVAGLERSASAMSVANNSLEETIALFASGQEITQDAEKMGTALRTISMRIRGYDEETEELSDDLTMITGKIADLTRTADNPRGVTLFEPGDPNTYRSTYDILRDISKIWDDLTDKNQAQLLELLFGKTRANQGAAILTNFEQAENAMETMKNAAGSADREMQISFDSIQYHLNELQQTWVGISQKLMERGTINDFIDGLTSISEAIGKIAESKVALAGVAGVLAGIVATANGLNGLSGVKGFGSTISAIVTGGGGGTFVTKNDIELFNLFTKTVEGQAGAFTDATLQSKLYKGMLDQMSPTARKIAEDTNKAGVSVSSFGQALEGATLKARGLAIAAKGASLAINLIGGVLAAFAISGAIKLMDDFIHREEHMAEAAKDARDKIAELNNELASKENTVSKLAERYAELAQEVDKVGTAFQSQGTLSNDEYKEFLDISNQLADTFPVLQVGVTDSNDAIINLTGSVDDITSSLKNLLEIERKLANQEILENADDVLKESNKKAKRKQTELDTNQTGQELVDNLLTALNSDTKITSGLEEYQHGEAWDKFIKELNKSNKFNAEEILTIANNEWDLTGLSNPEELTKFLGEYRKKLIGEMQTTNSELKAAQSDFRDVIMAYVETDSVYEDLDEKSQAIIRQVASNLTADMLKEYVDVDKSDEVTAWVDANVIAGIANAEPETKEAFEALLDGSITTEDLDTYWSKIQENFSEDDPIKIYFQSIIDGEEAENDRVFKNLGGTIEGRENFVRNETQKVRDYITNLTPENKTFLLKAEFSPQTFNNASEFINWIEEKLTGAIENSAKKAEATVAQTVKDYNVDVTPWINGLGDAYLKIFEEGKFSKKSMKNVDDALLESIRAQFELIESNDKENGGLGINLDDNALNDFLKTLSDVNSTQEEVQQGFNEYATMVFNAVGGMKDFNAETANTLKRMMSESGISNADDIVDGYTIASESLDAFTVQLDDANHAELTAKQRAIETTQERLTEANATDECRMAAFHYAYEQQRAAMVNMNVEGKVSALKTIASAYLTASQAADIFRDAQTGGGGIEGMLKRKDKAVKAGLSGTALTEMNKAIENKERSIEKSIEDSIMLQFDDYKKMGSGGSSRGGGGGHQEKEKEQFKENVDWIQRTIDIIERKITNLGKIASAQFLTWGQRLGVIPDQFSAITREMDVQTAAAQAYQREADAIGLSQEYINKLKNGELDIEEITDKDLHEKIKNYQEWQDKVEECTDKIQDLKADLANLAQEKLDKLMAQFEFITQQIEHANREAEFTRNTGNWAAGYSAINNQIENTYSNIANLQQQLATAQNMLNEAAKYGVEQGSEQWQNMVNNVNSIQEALLEAQEAIQDLAKAKFDRLVTKFERMAQVIDHTTSRIQALQKEAESEGYSAAVGYITRQYDDEQKRLEALREEQKKLQENMVKAVRKGQIKRNSDVWYDMLDQIEGVRDAIWESTAALADFHDQLRELDWSRFDYLEERYSAIKNDSDFLIDLIEKEKDLYEDNGNFTNYATTSQGLHVNNLQLLQKQNKDYLNELSELNNKLVDDPNNQKLLDRRQELIEQQHDIVDGITEERQAIKELAEDGYKTFLDYLQDIIDKRKEAMNAEREAYEYSRSINEKTKNITNFQKQIAALGGGNDQSEETRLRLQQLNNDLIKAQEDLQDAEYDKWKSDQEEMLDNMYADFENLINLKLEDLDGLVKEAKDETADAASTISQTIHGVVSEYGVALTDSQYGMRPLNETLSDIAHDVHEMMGAADERAEDGDIVGDFFVKRKFSDKKKSKLKTTVADVDTAKNSAILKAVQSKLKYNDFDWSTSALAYYYSALGFTDTYKNDAFHNRLLYNELEKLGYSEGGTIGGLIKRTGEDGFVLAQTGEEILSLDKIKEMQNVFTAMQPLANLAKAGNLNSVVEGATKQNIGGNTMNVGTIKFDLPNVQNYSDFVAQAKADPKFEKLIQQMTFGNAMGQNPLKKYTI